VVISGPSLASFDLFDPSLKLPDVVGQPVKGSFNATDSSFPLTWDRQPQTLYSVSKAVTITSFNPLTQVYSADSESGYTLTITGVSTPTYFARIAAIDYGLVPNAPSDLIATGHSVTLSDRSGNTLTLSFTGTASGTWSHSDSSSGTFTLYRASDLVPATGAGIISTSYPQRIPLYELGLDFDAPGGPNGWTRLSIMLSFHQAASGWVEGTAVIPGDPPTGVQVLQAFSYAP
jgi:hypothetical protein